MLADRQAVVLTALGDPMRRAIFERLAQGACAVGELARELPVTRPAVSQHLKVLKEAGLVVDVAAGTRRIYRIDPDGLAPLQAYLDRFWNRALEAFKDVAERPSTEDSMTQPATSAASSQTAAATAVRSSTVVEVPVERAFEVFTAQIGSWWDPDKHLLRAPLAEMIFEPWVGGNIIDRGVDGSECRWSRVLVYEPPTRVVFSWDINLEWELETDLARTSEIEVRFTPEGQATRVELEHRHLERHGRGWEAMRDAVAGGWTDGLRRFGEFVG